MPIFFVSDSPQPTGNFPDLGDPDLITDYIFDDEKQLHAELIQIDVDGKKTSITRDGRPYIVGVTTEPLADGGALTTSPPPYF